jgi:hypothetical protein|tara:strand:- start:244 stop:495 length:252 start_codon:yes stop_codon:yes gene_type:complete
MEDSEMSEKLSELNNKLFDINLKLSEEYTPIEVAGVFLAQAMRLYKTVLDDEDFSSMVEIIGETSEDIMPYELDNLKTNTIIH